MRKSILHSLMFGCIAPVALFGNSVSASPVISEVLYDADGTDNGLTFVELYGAPGTSLDGMLLEAVNGTGGTVYSSVALSGVIPADGVFLIGDSDAGATLIPGADLVAEVDYQNGPDSVVLRRDGTVLDAVGYGVFGAGDVFAGEGSPAEDPPSGSSIARFNPLIDTNDNSVDFVALAVPTPGSVPLASSVPVPGALLLFGSGLLSLVGFRHRSGSAAAATAA